MIPNLHSRIYETYTEKRTSANLAHGDTHELPPEDFEQYCLEKFSHYVHLADLWDEYAELGVHKWLEDQFGPQMFAQYKPNDVKTWRSVKEFHQVVYDNHARWQLFYQRIYLRNPEDVVLFKLTWQ